MRDANYHTSMVLLDKAFKPQDTWAKRNSVHTSSTRQCQWFFKLVSIVGVCPQGPPKGQGKKVLNSASVVVSDSKIERDHCKTSALSLVMKVIGKQTDAISFTGLKVQCLAQANNPCILMYWSGDTTCGPPAIGQFVFSIGAEL